MRMILVSEDGSHRLYYSPREQPAIRDLLENKYLHEWMHQAALRRCQELLL